MTQPDFASCRLFTHDPVGWAPDLANRVRFKRQSDS
jgi:hypothetical protein